LSLQIMYINEAYVWNLNILEITRTIKVNILLTS